MNQGSHILEIITIGRERRAWVTHWVCSLGATEWYLPSHAPPAFAPADFRYKTIRLGRCFMSYPTHMVVIPKQHIGSLIALDVTNNDLLLETMHVIRTVANEVSTEHGSCRDVTNLGDN